MVTTYQHCCPDSSMVLLGYSQGAQVTADFLCGTSSTYFVPTIPYSKKVNDSSKTLLFPPLTQINPKAI